MTLTAEPLRPLREVEGQPRVVIPSELEVFAEQRPGHAPEITVYVGTESIEGEFALTTPEARRMAAHLVALADALEQDVEVAAAE